MLIGEIAEMHQDIVKELEHLDPVACAATFAGLMVLPGLQANYLRLQLLVHLAACYGSGRHHPSGPFIQRSFEGLGRGWAGPMEDPSEDVFATLVDTPTGNFRVIEGVCEAAGFHLQRILNVVQRMPRGRPYDQLRISIDCLLRLSNAVLERAGVHENGLGREFPLAALPRGLLDRLARCRAFVRFTESELNALGISREHLRAFEFDLRASAEVRNDAMFHTGLERRPVVFRGEATFLLLPTAIGSAVTRFVIEEISAIGQLDTLELAVSKEYGRLFRRSPLLGEGPAAPIHFQRIEGGWIAAAIAEVDIGRFLSFVFVVEDLNGFPETGYSGTNVLTESVESAVSFHIKSAADHAAKTPGFKGGITLLAVCGIGRRIAFSAPRDIPDGWRLETISGFDLFTLCWVPSFDGISLFRLSESQQRLREEGVELLNANGILNLVAWGRQLKGHLVPHSEMPREFADKGGEKLVLIEQNAVRVLRHEVLTTFDPRRVLDINGQWTPVRRSGKSLFVEDNDAPLYVSEGDLARGRLRSVYVSKSRPYWLECCYPEDAPKDSAFEHWEMLNTWLRRAIPVIDRECTSLPAGPIEFEVRFAEIEGNTLGMKPPISEADLRSLVSIVPGKCSAAVRVEVNKGFDDGLQRPENFAERVIVEGLVAGASSVSRVPLALCDQARLVNSICPNMEARFMHRFEARSYREFVPRERSHQPLLIDEMDAGMYRVGLGWRVRARELGADVRGVEKCKSFLNSLVGTVLDDLCDELRRFDRRQIIDALLRNHETIECDRARWRRTASANIAIHCDGGLAVGTIVQHESTLNASAIASRVLLEAAVCECPLTGGWHPGALDLTRLMALVMIAHHWGGYSDAIHWGAAEPSLRVTPLGDVHFDHTFIDTVYGPFGRTAGEGQVRRAAAAYPERFVPTDTVLNVGSLMDPKFLFAWEAEFGISVDGMRLFLEALESACLEKPDAVVALPRSEVVATMIDTLGIAQGRASDVLKKFTLMPRSAWRSADFGFSNRDWYPWRFRRRLSILRRPFVQIDDGDAPDLVFAPGMVREAFALTVSNLYKGEIPDAQMDSAEMRSWLGSHNHKHRLAFNTSVANKMMELGWKVRQEVNVRALVGGILDRNYGDVDVVAWQPDSGRVIMMECKDVQYHKTLGEVAEQLHDFRGELLPNGRPDLLRKHLDRIGVLKSNQTAVARALKLREPISIEAHIVFKNPVPMQFVSERLASRIKLSIFSELDRL